jgi:GDP-mannose 6-dehydrogenase
VRISVFGLGYVGCVSAACLASGGHEITGVDVDPVKLSLLRQGRSPIVENGLPELIGREVAADHFRVTDAAGTAVEESDVSFVCVGTPSAENGSLDLRYVRRVTEQIGRALSAKSAYHVVVYRSTMLPGSVEDQLIPLLEEFSARRVGVDFGVAYNPEFLREGSSIVDFQNPPRTVIGQSDERSGDVVARIYAGLDAPLVRTTIRVAETVKYVDNAFHALKVAFANEIGSFCKSQDVDSFDVMDIFCLDTKLNLSPAYLKPGFAFGGSCLPKDLRALTHQARSCDVSTPLLDAITTSNEQHKRIALDLVLREKHRRVGVLGLSFKAGTDDLRESPAVELIEMLIGKGYAVKIHDRKVSLASLFGSNRAYIEREIPHIASLMCESVGEVVEWADTIVVANRDPEYDGLMQRLRPNQVAVDLVRIPQQPDGKGRYVGIAW